jgi:hypothetical protein
LEQRFEETVGEEERRRTERETQSWLARFAPLLDDPATLRAGECRKRLELLERLREEAPKVAAAISRGGDLMDAELRGTYRQAVDAMSALEETYRRRLAVLAPGDPGGLVDLENLKGRIAEVQAREELGAITGVEGSLDLVTSRSNWGAAGCMGVFSLGWLSFTTVHAVFMIGGMTRAFGAAALFLLLFYSIFWGVGLAMAAGAAFAAMEERVSIEGRELRLIRSLFGRRWEKSWLLGARSRARIEPAAFAAQSTGKNQSGPRFDLVIDDEEGKPVRFARNQASETLQTYRDQINEYLVAAEA